MINRGLVHKSLLETAWGTVLFAAGLCAFHALAAVAAAKFYTGIVETLAQLEIARYILAALLGTSDADIVGPAAFAALPWVHPLPLVLLFAHAITYATRMPAGETDHGTIDVLLAFPVSRATVYASESVAWMVSSVMLFAGGFLGHFAGAFWTGKDQPPSMLQLLMFNANLFTLYLAVGGVAWISSAVSNRRGRAAGATFAVLLASMIVSAMASFNEVIARIGFLGLLYYFRPFQIVQGGDWPLQDLLILFIVALAAWITGLCIFRRRDLPTI